MHFQVYVIFHSFTAKNMAAFYELLAEYYCYALLSFEFHIL